MAELTLGELARLDEAIQRFPAPLRWLARRQVRGVDLTALSSLFRSAQESRRPVTVADLTQTGVPTHVAALGLRLLHEQLAQSGSGDAELFERVEWRAAVPPKGELFRMVAKALLAQLLTMAAIIASVLAVLWWWYH